MNLLELKFINNAGSFLIGWTLKNEAQLCLNKNVLYAIQIEQGNIYYGGKANDVFTLISTRYMLIIFFYNATPR